MSTIPKFKWETPVVNHKKLAPYVDFPVVYNATVTTEPFYVEYDWTFVTSDAANTTLYKWNGATWTTVSGWSNPERFYGRGFFAVTTAANAYVSITEHVKD